MSTAQAASVTAMWNPNPEPDILGYKLLYGTQSGTYSTTIDVGNVTTWTLTTLASGTRYFFAVRAYNSANLLSPLSTEVFFDTPGSGPPTLTGLSPNTGGVGSGVTLSGFNFGSTQGTSTVTFNGTAASPTSWSPSSITLPVPNGATTGNVVVTVAGAASNGMVFTVAAAPAPSITGLSPSSGTVGSTVTISGANFGASQGTSTVKFNGTTATPTAWSATSVAVTVPAGATSGGVVVTVNNVASNASPYTVTTSTLPAPWQTQDVGNPAVAGTASAASGIFTVTGAGADIWDVSDQFRFVYQTFDGDGQIVARVDSLQNVDPWSKAGVMIRGDLTAGAANAMSEASAANGTVFQSRVNAGGLTTSVKTMTGAVPQWVRLVRTGNTLTGYYSADGAAWTLISSSSVTLPTHVFVGLVVLSHNAATAATASFSNVTVTSGTVASPTITSLSPTTGVIGTSVTITGSAFGSAQGTSTVKFNGTTATPTNWSPTSIVVPVPAGATTGNVIVSVGGIGSNGSPFTVTPPPTITSQPQSQFVVSGLNTTLSVGASSATSLSYQWYLGTSGTTTTPIAGATGSSFTTPSLTASTNYWVRVTNTAGSTDSSTAAITVGTAPPGVLVQDTFTGAAGSALTAHLPNINVTGNPWSVLGGPPNPTLSASGVGVTTGAGHLQATINSSGAADVVMGVDYHAGSGPGMGALAVRLTDTNNYFVLETYLNALNLYKRQAGTWVLLGTQSLPTTLAPGSTHRLEVRTLGATLEGWWDGVRLLQVSDSFQQTATRHGLDWNSAYDSSSTYGNFQLALNGTAALAPSIASLSPTSGLVGASVTITGSNFGATQGTSTVKFNGTTATPTSWSATSIVAPVPSGATTGNVVVTVGSSASNGSPFTVVQPPTAPTITSQPQSQTVPSGQTATLSVAASSATSLSYQWYVGTSGTTTTPISGATASSFTTPALTASANYWVRVTNTVGSTNSATAAITVSVVPTGVLVQDTFTGSAGAQLTAHLADVNLTGNPWAVTGGPPTPTLTTGGVGVTTAGSGHMQATINSGVADIVMGVDYRVGSGPGMGALAVRLTDVNNFFVLETYLNTLNLYKRQGGTWVFLASQPLPALAPGSTHRLEVRTIGATLEGWWDGVRLLQVSDSFQQTATRHGLDWNTAYDTTSTYDNFQLAVAGAVAAVAPTITSQPQSQTVPSGQTATLSVAASSATSLSYQWYVGTSGTTTTPISGATASSFTTPALTASTNYWVRVSNTVGSTDSATAAITVSVVPTGVLVQDTFAGSAGTQLTAHFADVNLTGNPWAVTGGPPTPTLTTGGVGVTAGSGHMQATINSGVADIVMGVDYRVGSGAGMGALAVRLTDVNNFFVLETYLNTLNLYKRQGGTWVFLASQPLPALAPGSTHRLEVRTLGATLEGWWDGVRLLQVSDSFQQNATRHGLDWNTAYDSSSIYGNFQLAVQQ